MKHLNKLIKASPLLLLPIMGGAMATDITVPLNFTTLPVITINEVTPMAFGDVLSLTQADTCTLDALSGLVAITPSQEGADLNSATYGSALAATSAGDLANDCDGAADGQVGIYEILSFADANITVSVTVGVDTDISFTPIGYVTNLDEAGPAASRETLSVGVDAAANASLALSAFAAAGTNRAVIGGTITNLVTLTAGSSYATDFNLNVVYQ